MESLLRVLTTDLRRRRKTSIPNEKLSMGAAGTQSILGKHIYSNMIISRGIAIRTFLHKLMFFLKRGDIFAEEQKKNRVRGLLELIMK